jgi:DNA polymerase-3 subunit delta
MAAISHQHAESYLERLNKDHFLFLVFGSDQGLVFERSRAIATLGGNASPGGLEVKEFSGDAVAGDALSLIDEINAISLFGPSMRLIRISVGAKSLLPALEMIARAPPENCLIVLEAGDLRRDAGLRKWIEEKPFAVGIECRPDDSRDIQRLIDSELKASGLSISPEAREALGSILGEDRLSTRLELEKLALYCHGRNSISLEDIHDIGHDASTSSIEGILGHVLSGNPQEAAESVARAIQQGVEINAILAIALRQFMTFHRARADIDRGSRFDEVLQTALRSIGGYGRKKEISNFLAGLSLNKAEVFVRAVAETTKLVRQKPELAVERTERLFIFLAAQNRHISRSTSH